MANYDQSKFLTSSPTVALEYRHWLNKYIYGSNNKCTNLLWKEAWNTLFDSPEVTNFRSFLATPVGEKWLDSKQGELYRKWLLS
jgi:hypothetical protein